MTSQIYEITHMPVLSFIVLALAVYRVTRVITRDEVFSALRDKVWNRFPPESTYTGFFFTCEWCVSLWVSLPTMILYVINPSITLLVGCIFALSAVSSLITARLDD